MARAGPPSVVAGKGLPHASQKRLPRSPTAPHEGQAVAKRAPHWRQKRDLSLLSALHWEQRITRALPPCTYVPPTVSQFYHRARTRHDAAARRIFALTGSGRNVR